MAADDCPRCGAGVQARPDQNPVRCVRCDHAFIRETARALTLMGRSTVAGQPPEPRSEIQLPATFLEKYKLGSVLGVGGMGMVCAATRRADGHPVAVKMMYRLDDAEALARFLREGRMLGALRHPNVIQMHDAFEADGHPFLVMEQVEGGTLRARLDQHGRLPPENVVALGSQILAGLGACHDAGIIHRDLKPENILFTKQGAIKIADLGIARFSGDEARLTKTGFMMGTPTYMSPEQARGENVGVGSDVYAVAVILYESLSGRPPFVGDNVFLLLEHHIRSVPPPLGTVAPGTPEPLVTLIHRALAKDPADRPVTAADFSRQLLRAGSQGALPPLGPADGAPAGPRRHERPRAESPQRPAPRQPPTSPPSPALFTRIRAAVLMAVVVVIGLGFTGGSPPLQSPRESPAGSPIHVEATPKAKTASVPGVFERWRGLVDLRSALKTGGEVGHRASLAARERSRLELGRRPAPWLFWLDLGKWLGNADRPGAAPRERLQTVATAEGLPGAALEDELEEMSSGTESALATALRLVALSPSDGGLWLVLARAIETTGGPSVIDLYRWALTRPLHVEQWKEAPAIKWEALARGLLVTRRHEFVEQWWAHAAPLPANWKLLLGLRAALEEDEPDLLDEVLRAGTRYPLWKVPALTHRGLAQAQAHQPRNRVIATWNEGLSLAPADRTIEGALCRYLLFRGREELYKPILDRLPAETPVRLLATLSTASPADRSTWPKVADDRTQKSPLAVLMLEAGDLAGAEGASSNSPTTAQAGWTPSGAMVFALIGRGSKNFHVAVQAGRILEERPAEVRAWDMAAGALGASPGHQFFTEQLEKLGAHDPPRSPERLWKALWLGRRGSNVEALNTLAALPPEVMAPPWVPCELKLRALWNGDDALVSPENLAAAQARITGPWRELVSLWQSGDIAAVRERLDDLADRYPDLPLIPLALARASVAQQGLAEDLRMIHQARVMARLQSSSPWLWSTSPSSSDRSGSARSSLASPAAPGSPSR